MTSNLAEFLDSALSSAREYPIMALIEYIRTMLMRYGFILGVLQKQQMLTDLTQITLRSELFSQIRCSIVVLRDRIHKELGNLINLIRVIKLG